MPRNRTPLSVERILEWADDHLAHTGEWPRVGSGLVLANMREHWRKIDSALRTGLRSLLGGSSLARLLGARRGVPNPAPNRAARKGKMTGDVEKPKRAATEGKRRKAKGECVYAHNKATPAD